MECTRGSKKCTKMTSSAPQAMFMGNYAHKLDIAVQYWTINTAEEMEYLQSVGADTIMTDRPDIGADTLNRP